MKRKLGDAQFVGVVRQLEVGRRAPAVAREVGVVRTYTIYAWRAKLGRLQPNEATRMRHLERREQPAEEAGGGAELGQEMLKAFVSRK